MFASIVSSLIDLAYLDKDAAHYVNTYGITDCETFDRDMLIGSISDAHKDLHGIRPRWYNWDEMTTEALVGMLHGIALELDEQCKTEAEQEAEHVEACQHYMATGKPATHNPFANLASLLA